MAHRSAEKPGRRPIFSVGGIHNSPGVQGWAVPAGLAVYNFKVRSAWSVWGGPALKKPGSSLRKSWFLCFLACRGLTESHVRPSMTEPTHDTPQLRAVDVPASTQDSYASSCRARARRVATGRPTRVVARAPLAQLQCADSGVTRRLRCVSHSARSLVRGASDAVTCARCAYNLRLRSAGVSPHTCSTRANPPRRGRAPLTCIAELSATAAHALATERRARDVSRSADREVDMIAMHDRKLRDRRTERHETGTFEQLKPGGARCAQGARLEISAPLRAAPVRAPPRGCKGPKRTFRSGARRRDNVKRTAEL